MRDLVVVVPGIMGSSLYRHGKPVWEASVGAVMGALRSRLENIRALRLPAGIGDGPATDEVVARGLIADVRLPLGLWTFDLGYTRLLEALKARPLGLNDDAARGPVTLLAFAYDWRLSNRHSGERLREVVEPALARLREHGGEYREAKLVFVCHSMGGLVARWYVDRLGGSANTRALITLGTPHRGALYALDALVNGARKGPGPIKVDLTAFGRSLPSLYQLLPEYACIESGDALRKTTEIAVPCLDGAMAVDAMRFHLEIDAARDGRNLSYELHPLGGYDQPTWTTARVTASGVECLYEIDGSDERGDGTVPRLSFTPLDVKPASAAAYYAADNHAGLVHNEAIVDQIEGILTAQPVVHRGGRLRLSVDMPEQLDPGEQLVIRARLITGEAPIEAVIVDEAGRQLGQPIRLTGSDAELQAVARLPGPGVYRVTVRGAGSYLGLVSPITSLVHAWPSENELLG